MSTLFEGGCCGASERLNEIRNAAASNVVERKGGRVKVEIAVFIGELLCAETKMRGRPRFLSFTEYSALWSYVKSNSLGVIRRQAR